MDGSIDPVLQGYYDLGEEHDRLTQAHGILEFERTKEIVLRHLPDPPSVVADIGGGPGVTRCGWPAEVTGSNTAT